jgi:hypothetical protein
MRTVLDSILRAEDNSGNVCLGPSLRNHGLITGWKILVVLFLTRGVGIKPCVLPTRKMMGSACQRPTHIQQQWNWHSWCHDYLLSLSPKMIVLELYS